MITDESIVNIVTEIMSGFKTVSQASKEYKISRVTIYNWMDKMGLKAPSQKRRNWEDLKSKIKKGE